MAELSTMLTNFVEKCASDENLRNKAIAIFTSDDKSKMSEQLVALAEEAGVPFNGDEALKLIESPEVMEALGLNSESGLGSLLNMAESFLGKK